MANTLSASSLTSVSWSLSDANGTSRSGSRSYSRSISHGTGPNQANVAWSETFSTTGLGSASWTTSQVPVYSFGFAGSGGFTVLKELYVAVTTGPTGGYMTFGASTGATGVRVNVGSRFHLADYLTGLSPAAEFVVSNGITGVYQGEITVIGNGYYESA